MPDICDDAQQAEAYVLQEALARMPCPDPDEEQIRDDEGRIVCLDCGEPVPPARLARVPTATRCTECQAEEDDLRRMGGA